MLSVYSNQNNILNSPATVTATRLDTADLDLLKVNDYAVSILDTNDLQLETHVYTPDGVYLASNHNTSFNSDVQHINVDLDTTLHNLGITRGQYKVAYGLYNSILGSFNGQKLFIKEISPSRTELRLFLADNKSTELLKGYQDLYKSVKDQTSKNYVLNLGNNNVFQIINFQFGSIESTASTTNPALGGLPEVIVKLYNRLPDNFNEKSQCWIADEVIPNIIDTIQLIPKQPVKSGHLLAGPNFNLTEFEKSSIGTEYKAWNDLLGSSLPTSQQIIDSYFASGSIRSVKLNIDYSDFNNFVHFSSAAERVENFYYKLQLIESYTSTIQSLNSILGDSTVQVNLADYYNKRNVIVSNFDDFEKYLFFQSDSGSLYSNYDVTGSINPWPKKSRSALTWADAAILWSAASMTWENATTDFDPYGYFSSQVNSTSTAGLTYYNDLLEAAQEYDRNNIHRLRNTVPSYLLEAEESSGGNELSLFVDMLGQHFDILWTYIHNLTTINSREEHPQDGMPDELLYHTAKSMGFELLNGKSSSELWSYVLGVDSNGDAISNSTSEVTAISDDKNTKEIWRRIVNNLPYLLKTKGTSRSIKALISCFGIPSSILTIKEYGGPSTFTNNDFYPEYVHNVYHYTWSSLSGSLQIPSSSYVTINTPNTLEFRIKVDDNSTFVTGNSYEILRSSGLNYTSSLTLTKTSDTLGTLTYTVSGSSGSVAGLTIFDNSWHSIIIDRTNSTGSLKVAKSLYGNQIYILSASLSDDVPDWNDSIYFGTGSNKLYGNFHEIRLWSGSLNDATINEHAASAATYTYNVDRSALHAGEEASKPYDHLVLRYSLSTNLVNTGSGYYQNSIQPDQSYSMPINFINISSVNDIIFEGIEETYYTPSPSLGNNSLYTNKVRIDSGSIIPGARLNTHTRVEKSSLDKFSIDSNRLGIYFSPQTAINEDIFNQLGYFEIDDYIGNPADVYNSAYSDFTSFSQAYWKKYQGKNNFESYFRALRHYDYTLFEYIKKLLPVRVNLISGIVIEPNVLERSKVTFAKLPSISNLTYSATITNSDTNPVMSAEYLTTDTAVISSNVDNVDRLGSSWMQHRYIGRYKITESGSYTPISVTVLNSRQSEHGYVTEYFYSSAASASLNLPYSSSLSPATVTRFLGTGFENNRYNGCKLIGSAINVDSVNTIDGGPVVKVTKVNPNQLVFASNQITTLNQAVSGQRVHL